MTCTQLIVWYTLHQGVHWFAFSWNQHSSHNILAPRSSAPPEPTQPNPTQPDPTRPDPTRPNPTQPLKVDTETNQPVPPGSVKPSRRISAPPRERILLWHGSGRRFGSRARSPHPQRNRSLIAGAGRSHLPHRGRKTSAAKKKHVFLVVWSEQAGETDQGFPGPDPERAKRVGATPGLPGRSPIPVLFRPTGA